MTVEQQLRRFLLVVACLLCLGTIVELWLVEHTADVLQWVPFVLSAAGLAVIAAALYAPRRGVLLLLRGVTAALMLCSLLGIYLHVNGNAGFALEIQPDIPQGELLWDAISGGNPLLAPGILALAALLAAAATYRHPALQDVKQLGKSYVVFGADAGQDIV